MPDISMCTGEEAGEICPEREDCYRYMAKPDPDWQAYARFFVLDGLCTHKMKLLGEVIE